jgi:hypothetical protein
MAPDAEATMHSSNPPVSSMSPAWTGAITRNGVTKPRRPITAFMPAATAS